MTADRANPFVDLGEFEVKSKPRPIEKAAIERLAQETGFPSRQAPSISARPATVPITPSRKKGRRYTTGRNQQINIKAKAETIERLYKIADARNVPLGEVLELALDALDRKETRN